MLFNTEKRNMVLKCSKFGKNTGNTQRKTNLAKIDENASYLQENELSWLKQLNKNERAEVLKLLSETEISFSNNKRKRWGLNEKINELKLNQASNQLFTSVGNRNQIKRKHQKRQVVDRKQLHHPDYKLAVKLSPNETTTIWANNINIKLSTKTKRKDKLTNNNNNGIRQRAQKSFTQKMSCRRQNIRKKDSLLTKYIMLDEDELVEEEDWMEFDDNSIVIEEKVNFTSHPNRILGDFLVPNNVIKQSTTPTKVVNNNPTIFDQHLTAKNENLFFIERPVRLQVKEKKQENTHIQFPFEVVVDSQCIAKTNLENEYGCKYIEGQSYPRRFAIFTSLRIHATIVMVEVLEEGCETSNIKIGVHGLTNNIKIPSSNTDVFNSIIQSVRFKTPQVKDVKTPNGSFSLFLPRHIPTQSTVNEDVVFAKLLTLEKSKGQQFKESEEFVFVDKEICRICHSRQTSFITFRQCGHRFCKECIKSYCKMSLKKATCMQSGCDIKIDLVTVLSVLETKSYGKYCYTKLQTFVNESKGGMKYCPTIGCNSIAFKESSSQTDTNRTITENALQVTCGYCNKCWCFDCQRHHWPLSCSIFKNYLDYREEFVPFFKEHKNNLRKLRDMLKICPNCGILIEKNGGCHNMFCVNCSTPFCWMKAKGADKGRGFKAILIGGQKALDKSFYYGVRCAEILELMGEMGDHLSKGERLLFDVMYECNALAECFEIARHCCKSRHEKKRYSKRVKQLNNFIKLADSLFEECKGEDVLYDVVVSKSNKIFKEVKSYIELIFNNQIVS